MDITLETLQAIDMLENARASDISEKLNITPSAFSNRINNLLNKNLVKQIAKGKEKWYSLTESGTIFLKAKEGNNKESDSSEFIDILKILLKKSFDDTYQLIDIFFEKPLCFIANCEIFKEFELDLRDTLITNFYRSLIKKYISLLIKNLTKNCFQIF